MIEFFSYGCPHCNDFHPLVSKWSAKLSKDVIFKRVPTSLGRAEWANLAKAYYALEATGYLAKLDSALFDALHRQRLPLVDEQRISAWVGKQGLDAAKFAAAFNSFSVNTKASEAEELTGRYLVAGLPTLVVAGRYVVIGRTREEMLTIADQLIAKARAEGSR